MLGGKKPAQSWRSALKFLGRCPICDTAYEPEKARRFAQKETASMVHITCAKCRGNFVAMVVMLGHGLSTVGMITDLNFDDASRLYASEPVSLDEILSSHEALKKQLFKI